MLHRSPSLLWLCCRFLDGGGRVWFGSSWRTLAVVVCALVAGDLSQEEGSERSHLGLDLRLRVPATAIRSHNCFPSSAHPCRSSISSSSRHLIATFLFLSGIARPEILGRRELGGQVETIARFQISERFQFLYVGTVNWCAAAENEPL